MSNENLEHQLFSERYNEGTYPNECTLSTSEMEAKHYEENNAHRWDAQLNTKPMNAKDQLKQMELDEFKRKYPNVPSYAIPKAKAKKSPANQLTADIVKWITMNGGWATRINIIARQVKGVYIPSTTETGTPDIIGCLNGKFFSVEVKIGKDRQNEEQLNVQKKIERAKGFYFIAKDFDQFMKHYATLTT